MDNLETAPVAGAETTADTRPIWSPDSRQIAYFAEGKLKKISVDGGPAQTICDANGADGTWSTSGEILFDGAATDPIRRVSAGGGVPENLVLPNAEIGHASVAWPEWLPDGRHFLYMAGNQEGENFLVAGEIGSDEAKQLMPVSSRVQYVEPGYLLYIRDDTLVAHPFDASKLELTGDPRPIADHVGAVSTGHSPFTASQNGTLVFNSAGGSVHQLLWRDRTGRELGTLGDPAAYATFHIGPDPNRVVFDVFDDQTENRDLWVHDLGRGVSSRFTFHEGSDRSPLWSPDGSRIAFSSPRGTSRDIFVKNASGAGQAEILLEDSMSLHPCDWSKDGKYLVYMALSPESGWDIWALAPDGSIDPFAVVASPFIDARPVFSPDGRWLAYQTDESGRPEIYVQQFPEASGKWQVSTAGGTEPIWSPDGREIFYLDAGQNLVSVQVETGQSFKAGLPNTLFEAGLVPTVQRNRYVISNDGERFLMLTPMDSQSNPPMTVVQNWTVSLDR
jgi:Tol biopolymer transport system component